MKTKKTGAKKSIEIHGKDETMTAKRYSSLDEILGESLCLYNTKDKEEYASYLSEMNMTDLQAHAYKIGLVPTQDRKILSDRLLHEFIKWQSKTNSCVQPTSNTNLEDLSSKARKILREGA